MHKNKLLNYRNKLLQIMNNVNLKDNFLSSNFNLALSNKMNSKMIIKQNSHHNHNNNILTYHFNKQSNLGYKLFNKIILSSSILEHVFQNTFISRPKFKVSSNKIIITFFYYSLSEKEVINSKVRQLNDTAKTARMDYSVKDSKKQNSHNDKSNVDITKLEKTFINLFDTNVEIRLIKLYYPFLNSNILAKFITSINNNKLTANLAPIPLDKTILKSLTTKKSRTERVDSIFRKINLIKSYKASINTISNITNIKSKTKDYFINDNTAMKSNLLNLIGVKYEISGRMTRRRTASRSSLISKYKGTFKFNSNKSLIDYTKFSYKNKNGAFSVKVWLSSNNPSF